MPDVVVIGGGHNGLVAAAYLGAAGLKVTVLERRAIVGGAAAIMVAITPANCRQGRKSAAFLSQLRLTFKQRP